MSKKERIDATDIEMLNVFRKEATVTNKSLASKISLTPGPTLKRHNKLVKGGYIMGYQARVNYAKLGYTYWSLLIVSIHERHYDNLCEMLQDCEAAKNIYTIPADKFNNRPRLMILTISKSEEEFTETFSEFFDSLPFEVLFSSYPISHIVKDDLSIPIR
jgi:Lrp/AsnC family leucine-responsive transcriptional regulator